MQGRSGRAAARRRQKAWLPAEAKLENRLASDSDRGNAVDLHVERTVPGGHADEAARRGGRREKTRGDRNDGVGNGPGRGNNVSTCCPGWRGDRRRSANV